MRIAVIGTGWWATYAHLPALEQRSDVELVALADRSAENLEKAADMFGVANTYTDYRAMLDREKLDGVVVAASHAVHYDAVLAALEHDCHVLVEKPLTLEGKQARHLGGLAQKRAKSIVLSCPWGFTRHTQRARQVVMSGELGEVRMVASLFSSWAYETYGGDEARIDAIYDRGLFGKTVIRPSTDANVDPRAGGGQGWCQMSHAIALLLRVTELRAATVCAFMDHLDVDVDVVDAISARLSNGAVCTLASTGQIPAGDAGQHQLCVYASGGYLILDAIEGTLTICHRDTGIETSPRLTPDERYPRFAPAKNFIDVILGRAENQAPCEMGCGTVELLEAAYQSAANEGKSVTVTGDHG